MKESGESIQQTFEKLFFKEKETIPLLKGIIKESIEKKGHLLTSHPIAYFDVKALYRALDEKRRSRKMSWSQVQKEIAHPGSKHPISISTIRGTKTGRTAEADGILAMVRWLGMTFQDFSVGVKNPAPPRPLKEGETLRRFDARAFYSALDKERQQQGLSWKQFTEQEFPGWSPAMLTRLVEGGRMDASKVVALFAWLHRSAESYTHANVHGKNIKKGYCHRSLRENRYVLRGVVLYQKIDCGSSCSGGL
jgi:hypothetical protein